MRLSRRGLVRIVSFSLAAIFTLTGALLISRYETVALQRELTAHYRRSYFELLSSLESIESSLAKASVSSSPESLALLSSDIWNSAETAGLCLGELPCVFSGDSQTAAFLNRVGSFSYSLASDAGRGDVPDDDGRRTLSSLRRSAGDVLRSLSGVSAYIYEDDFFSSVTPSDDPPVDAYDLSSGMMLLESAFPETPTLLYDGPYSEHLTNVRPVVTNQKEVDREEAACYAASLFEADEVSLLFEGEVAGDIPCYLFTLRNGRSLSLLVSRYGGKLLGLTSSGDVSFADSTFDEENAIRAAQTFLEKAGYTSLVPSYHHEVGGVSYINFEASEDGVIFYPDLIQIGVSLSDGEIISFDARGYLSNHKERELPAALISPEEATKNIAEGLSILSVRSALIPTEGKNELYCYEIAVSSKEGDRFLFYINCETGREEKVMLLKEDETGVLAF